MEHVGPIAYHLTLLLKLSNIYNVYHVSMLRKYRLDLGYLVQLETLNVKPNLNYEELVQILDMEVKKLKHKRIPLVKVF